MKHFLKFDTNKEIYVQREGERLLSLVTHNDLYHYLELSDNDLKLKVNFDSIHDEVKKYKKKKGKYILVFWGNSFVGLYNQKSTQFIAEATQVSNVHKHDLALTIIQNVPNNSIIRVLKEQKMLDFKKERQTYFL